MFTCPWEGWLFTYVEGPGLVYDVHYENLEEISKVNILKSSHSYIAGALNRYKYKMQQKPLGTLGQI